MVTGQSRVRANVVEERRLIVEETLEAGSSVARVAMKHGVNANQVFKSWPASTKVVQRITAPKDRISVEHSGVFLFGSKSSSCICSLAWKNLFAVPAERIIAC